jgi:hypothetical protein
MLSAAFGVLIALVESGDLLPQPERLTAATKLASTKNRFRPVVRTTFTQRGIRCDWSWLILLRRPSRSETVSVFTNGGNWSKADITIVSN